MALLQPKLIDTLPLYQLPIATVMLCNKATKKYMTYNNNHSLLPVTLKSSGQFWSQLSFMPLWSASSQLGTFSDRSLDKTCRKS